MHETWNWFSLFSRALTPPELWLNNIHQERKTRCFYVEATFILIFCVSFSLAKKGDSQKMAQLKGIKVNTFTAWAHIVIVVDWQCRRASRTRENQVLSLHVLFHCNKALPAFVLHVALVAEK